MCFRDVHGSETVRGKMIPGKNGPWKNGLRKNGPRKIGPRKIGPRLNARPTIFCFQVLGLFRTFHAHIAMLNARPTIFCFRVLGLFASSGFVSNIPRTHHDAQRPPHDFLFPSFGFVCHICLATILPGINFPGTNFSGINFPGTIFPGDHFSRDHFSRGSFFRGPFFRGSFFRDSFEQSNSSNSSDSSDSSNSSNYSNKLFTFASIDVPRLSPAHPRCVLFGPISLTRASHDILSEGINFQL